MPVLTPTHAAAAKSSAHVAADVAGPACSLQRCWVLIEPLPPETSGH